MFNDYSAMGKSLWQDSMGWPQSLALTSASFQVDGAAGKWQLLLPAPGDFPPTAAGGYGAPGSEVPLL